MFTALIVISLYISAVDFREHRIANRALGVAFLILLSLSFYSNNGLYPITGLFVLIFTPLILFSGIGAGDIKLLAMLSFFFIPPTWQAAATFLLAFSLIATALLAYQLGKTRSFSGSVALAPAICGAVIWCAR
jgi:Flp pilus assembly protein protease CpaA